jgi:GNAT superfamily N-acetyltransferase
MAEVEIRNYQNGDELNIILFLKQNFKNWPRPHEDISDINFWKWKYLDTPTKTKLITVAESENEIIGCHHSVFFSMKLYDEIKLGFIGADIAVHSKYRGKGIWKKMFQKTNDRIKELDLGFSYGITTNPTVKDGWKKMGEIFFPHHISLLYWIKDIRIHQQKSEMNLYKIGYLGLKILNSRSIRGKKSIPQLDNDLDVTKISYFGKEYETFWSRTREEYTFTIEKNLEYVNWRYCDERGGKYYVISANQGKEFLGFIVLKTVQSESGYNRGYVVDVQALPGRDDVVDALLRSGIEYFKKMDVNFVQALIIRDHPFEKTYLNNGFVRGKNHYSVLYQERQNEQYYEEFYNAPSKKIQFQFGDVDLI